MRDVWVTVGFSKLEFVGKVVSEKGLQISHTKIQSILDNQRTYEMYHPVSEPSGFDYSVVTEISPLYLD